MRKLPPRQCDLCTAKYTPTGQSQLYCQDCGAERANEQRKHSVESARAARLQEHVMTFDDLQNRIARANAKRTATMERPPPILPGSDLWELIRDRRRVLMVLKRYDAEPMVDDDLGDLL